MLSSQRFSCQTSRRSRELGTHTFTAAPLLQDDLHCSVLLSLRVGYAYVLIPRWSNSRTRMNRIGSAKYRSRENRFKRLQQLFQLSHYDSHVMIIRDVMKCFRFRTVECLLAEYNRQEEIYLLVDWRPYLSYQHQSRPFHHVTTQTTISILRRSTARVCKETGRGSPSYRRRCGHQWSVDIPYSGK